MNLYEKIKAVLYDKLVKPIITSHSPVEELALGIGVGLFWALTPLVGIQMYLVFLNWLLFKYLLGKEFDLVVGCALVWLSNPFTMFFLYYAFYYTGVLFYIVVGMEIDIVSFTKFKGTFEQILSNEGLSFWQVVYESTIYLFYDMGLPMLIGCVFYALPSAILGYIMSRPLILKSRNAKAAKLGITYEQWQEKYERQGGLNPFKKKQPPPEA